MAEFKAGDRVVKMSGAAAGKYGTVNSVREDGTLNVTFDGERLPRYCDPERCGQVAANAIHTASGAWYQEPLGGIKKSRFRKGATVVYVGKDEPSLTGKRARITDINVSTMPGTVLYDLKFDSGLETVCYESDIRTANSRAANAKFKVGDRFAPKDDLGMTLVVKKIVKHPTWGVVYAVDARGETWYTEDEMVARNSNAARNAVARNAGRVRTITRKAQSKSIKVGDRLDLGDNSPTDIDEVWVVTKVYPGEGENGESWFHAYPESEGRGRTMEIHPDEDWYA